MTLRIGVDMIEVARIERAASRHGERFFKRFFTDKERELCQDQPRRLAARLAAKEAAAKAFGTGIGDVRWIDIEVLHDERGRPFLQLHGEAAALAQKMGLSTWEVSLSHTQDNALAFVVATA
ncbi:MAG: holo-ACP synthase [Anaerolineae bacterium]|nr:holo-ACP synthase [Anaerolineae bacterium]